MNFFVKQIKNYLLLILMFVLPFQTRLIYRSTFLNNEFWEYGSLFLYGTEILLGFIILLFLIDGIRGNFYNLFVKNLNIKRLIKILFCFFGIIILYFITSVDRVVYWQYLNWVIYGVCLLFVVQESRLKFKTISLAIWGGGILQACLGIWQFFYQYIPANKWVGMAQQDPRQLGVAVIEFGDERWLRAYGSFGWPNSLGIYLATVFILGVILLWIEDSKKNKLGLLVGQIIILAGLFFSFARGAWLGALVALFILMIKKYHDKNLWQQVGVYSLVFFILVFMFKPLVFSRLNIENRLEKVSVLERVGQWSEFQKVFSKNYLVGAGPGNYSLALHELYPKHPAYNLKPPHNIYLLFLSEWGMVGLLLMSTVLVVWGKKNIFLFLPLLVILVAGFFDHWSISSFTGLVFLFLIVGMAIKSRTVDTLSV